MTQSAFAAALRDPSAPPPVGLSDGSGQPAGRRFDVYRNNVAASLIEAMEAAFPVVARLVGTDFFRATAGVFVRTHPPGSPLMMLYGAEFPGFLAGFPPAAGLPYLADVARLEQARREVYHAADARPFAAGTTQIPPDARPFAAGTTQIPPDALMRARLRFAPAVRLVRSPHPIHAIWRANTSGGPKPLPGGGEDVLVTRPRWDPVLITLPAGGTVLQRMIAGEPIGVASAAEPDADLAPLFGALIAGGAIVAVEGERR